MNHILSSVKNSFVSAEFLDFYPLADDWTAMKGGTVNSQVKNFIDTHSNGIIAINAGECPDSYIYADSVFPAMPSFAVNELIKQFDVVWYGRYGLTIAGSPSLHVCGFTNDAGGISQVSFDITNGVTVGKLTYIRGGDTPLLTGFFGGS